MPASTASSRPVVLDGDLDPSRYAHLTPAGEPAAPTLAQLAHAARTLASRPADWRHVLRFDPERRWRLRLESEPWHEAWVMTWLPGQRTGMHDHGDAAAVIAVAYGELRELSRPAPGSGVAVQAIRPGQVRIWGARHVREIVNAGDAPAVSIHLYAPALPVAP
jgi:predicted metal-dependent enzyme (double-stranded beta helix superfamily)